MGKIGTIIGCILTMLLSLTAKGQIGGLDTYQFLELSPSARATALGGHTIALSDEDVSMGLLNPAVLSDSTHQQASINHVLHVAGISHGYAAYGHQLDKLGVAASVGVQYVDYGEFIRSDEFGNLNGAFSGSEVAITMGGSKQIDERLHVGANFKFISSSIDNFGSFGIGTDLGLIYKNEEQRTNWSIVLRNIGGQISTNSIQRESLPIDFLIGVSKELKYLPFRWMITFHDLHRWDLRYDSEIDSGPVFIGQEPADPSPFSQQIDNFFRHIAVGGELMIGPKRGFVLRLGYDHQRKKELAASGFRSLSGLSFGFGFRVKRFQFDYGVGRQHLAGGTNHLSVRMNLQKRRL